MVINAISPGLKGKEVQDSQEEESSELGDLTKEKRMLKTAEKIFEEEMRQKEGAVAEEF
jgi:hypothetical protein